jgi:hypothetical protein
VTAAAEMAGDDGWAETVERAVRDSTSRQGLPEFIEDESVLDRVAAIVEASRLPPSSEAAATSEKRSQPGLREGSDR